MIKRTIEISQQPTHLTAKLDQLLLQRHGDTIASIPCEDLGVVIVDEPQTTYSHAALTTIVKFDGVVILCGRDHLPCGLLLPLADHTQIVWRLHEQLAISKPLAKQLWKQLVVAKVKAQAANLPEDSPARRRLLNLATEVRSGDTTNVEAQAARVYWSAWLTPPSPGSGGGRGVGGEGASGDKPGHDALGDDSPVLTPALSQGERGNGFRRDPEGEPPNNMLNYGYAVLRAVIARALVAHGLLPALGLKHHNRSNAFCLADDLLEPLRPIVDARARWLFVKAGNRELTQPVKASLLELMTLEARCGEERGPLMVAIQRMVGSLVACYQGQATELRIPVPA